MSNKDHNEEHLITDEEIAQTLLALNDASMDIPEDLHSEVRDLETDTQKALQEALEQQEILKKELEKYQQKEADEKNLANLKAIAQSELELKGLAQEKAGDQSESSPRSAGDDPTQAPHKPTVVRVSATGQVLNSKGEVVAVDRRSSDRGESVNVTTKRKFSDTFHYQLIMKVVVPMMLLMLAVLVVLSFVQYGRIEKEAENQLKNCAATFQNMFEKIYGNDIKLCVDENGSGQQWVQIGDRMLGEEDSLYLDSLKKDTGIDFSYFYENVRVLTTIRDKYNARLSFTTISENISNDVIRGGQEKYYDNVSIDGTRYYAYYMPVMDKTGKLCGMIALAKPNSMIINQMFSGLWPIIGMLLLVMAIMIFLTFRYSKGVTKVLSNVEAFTKRVAGGNLSAKLSNDVLRRKDEFGSMGSSIISMQHSLRELIEKDALTTLPNRRYADKHLKSIQEKSANSGIPFSVAIADIDFFKKVNDTYGHECGDVVLKQTALILKKGMRSKGFASRWGGEEFLLVFDKGDEDEAAKTLNWIRLEIEAQTIEYEGMTVRRTMSFGVTTGSPDVDGDMLLKDADDCLYEAKQSGRNRVITSSQLAAMKEKSE